MYQQDKKIHSSVCLLSKIGFYWTQNPCNRSKNSVNLFIILNFGMNLRREKLPHSGVLRN